MDILLHSDDINLLSYWENVLKKECKVVDDIADLNHVRDSIIVINYSAFNAKQNEMITQLSKAQNLLLVLHRVPNIQVAKELLSLGAKGYGNAMMREHFLLSAVETIKEGMVWLHPEFTSELIKGIPQKQEKDISSLLEELSPREKEVALLLKDAQTYKQIAQTLEITPRTVKAHAQSIYKKLHIKDRLALALLLK